MTLYSTIYKTLDSIKQIDHNNSFLPYIVDRILSDDYRGYQCSQHNRLTYDYFKIVILSIYEITGKERFRIHVGDDDGEKQIGAEKYYKIVDLIKKSCNKGTINSIKKNTFPDIARMGFLCRYNKKDVLIDENSGRTNVYSVQLSEKGIEFAEQKMEFDRRKYFTEGIDNITKNTASELVELLSTDDYVSQINILEYMYIISDKRAEISFKDKLEYLSEYRRLTDVQKKNLTKLLQEFCNPDDTRKIGNKTDMRDYHNWKNESQQIFGLLANTVYFKVLDDTLVMNDNKDYGLFAQTAKRKQSPKAKYFESNGINKCIGYELHHIIPFSKANTQKDAEFLDDERNLIYLEKSKHLEFTSSNNVNICVSYNKPIISFLEVDNRDRIINVNTETQEALLSEEFIPQMKEYNKKLLHIFYQI